MFVFLVVILVAAIIAVATGALDISALIAVCLIVMICFAPMWAAVFQTMTVPAWLGAAVTSLATLGWPTCMALGLGMAYLVDPETGTQVVEAFGELAGDLAMVATDIIGDVTGSLLSSPLGLLAVGALVWFLWPSSDDEERKHVKTH